MSDDGGGKQLPDSAKVKVTHSPTIKRRAYRRTKSVTMRYDDDPRLAEEYVRELPAAEDEGTVTLVGVVHDHPASKFRAQRVIQTLEPETLALELPPLAVPLFTEYARNEQSPPPFGGEMSTAAQAASTDRIVGIDGPSIGFVGHLLEEIKHERPSLSSIRAVADSLTSVSKHAVVCRLGAVVSQMTGLSVEVDEPAQHECEWTDGPAIQARDEHEQVQQAQTVMNAFQSQGSSDLRQTARERHMADKLETLRQEGTDSIVAVVGIAHLDPLVERLTSN